MKPSTLIELLYWPGYAHSRAQVDLRHFYTLTDTETAQYLTHTFSILVTNDFLPILLRKHDSELA